MKFIPLNLATSLLIIFVISDSRFVFAITKCKKDSNDNWLYADVVSGDCSKSEWIRLNKNGLVRERIPAPVSGEELEAQKQAQAVEAAEQARLHKREQEKERILNIYASEQDIDRQRDKQLQALQVRINVHLSYLENLNKNIAIYEQRIAPNDQQTELGSAEKRAIETKHDVQQLQKITADRVEAKKQLEELELDKQNLLKRFAREKQIFQESKAVN